MASLHQRLTLLAGLLLVSGAACAQLSFGNVLPGGGVVKKNVLSMREARFLNLIEQRTDFSCGAAAVATILNYAYARRLTEAEVIQGMLEVSDAALVKEQGFSLLDMKRYAEKIGLRARGYELPPESLEQIRIPVIVLLDVKGYKHFVVLRKAAGGRVYLGDPALGNRVVSREEFAAGWNGIVLALIGADYVSDGVLANPPEPLTARGLRGVHATTVAQVRLLEFGPARADLF